ncbi:MAG TPA: hypothetical protein PLF11_08375 [Bacillota bacterium]|nr:hypothetical protein [Bacillota bacterium]
MELQPKATVFTDGQFYKVLIEGVAKSLLCEKLGSGEPATTSTADLVEARIVGMQSELLDLGVDEVFSGLQHGNIYKLDNGQVWQQTDFHIEIHVAVMPRVTIWKEGSMHKMQVEGTRSSVTVEQLK